ncbi:hybrid sensor histidine kinase/response regulator [Azospirillum thermophilum]|uniref:histidine kinase n=1 Tax=Azospirillum thermophilum TaxID=2202148 RepID=A0A2S2CSK0_9PROT|nr:hybrid sensor histidine kinase/response regulator [Azospirillum thermophilum]AWK87491.1 hybrid sensor histidine kinase/response regulator [Azospirillum thermophilum]
MAGRTFEAPGGKTGSLRLLRLLLAASVLVPLLLFGAIAWHDYEEVKRETGRNTAKTAQILHEHMTKVFDTLKQVMDRVDERSRGMSWEEVAGSYELHLFLKGLERELEQVGAIGLVAPDGRVMGASRTFPVGNHSIADRAYFRDQAAADRGLLVSEGVRSNITGRQTFTISRRRSTPDGRFDGLIVATVDPDYFASFYQRVLDERNEVVSIFRADGSLLIRYPILPPERTLVLRPDRGLLHYAAQSPEGVYRAYGQGDGVERYFGYKKVDGYPVYVVYAIPMREVRAIWMRNVAVYAAGALPATLALALIAWLALARTRSEAAAMRRWAEEVRNREVLEEALRQSQKMEALGQLTGGVAHDFNNLLTAAQSNLQLLSRHLAEEGRRYLGGAAAALERAEKLTRQLLSFSRQEAVNPTVIEVGHALRQMEDLLERSIRADIALDWAIADGPLAVEVDPVQFELAVLNLVLNARDAMPMGGRIRISAAPGAQPDTVDIAVADTGRGMPPEVLARAFEPFFTTKPLDKGTGLGLSMVYGFARQSGGGAEIESSPGQGTRVTLTLPATAKPLPAASPAPSAAPAAARPVRVLVVEDNALVLMAIVEGLEQEGFTVETAEHGAAALQILERDQTFDMVVSDVVMPYGVSGIDLVRRIRERWPRIPVLLASGYSPESLATMGADTAAVLAKPFTPDQLAMRIRALLVHEAA